MTYYWVYEDDSTNRARLHKATCSRCNDGQGMKGSRFPTIGGTALSEPYGKP